VRNNYFFYLLIVACVVLLDQVSKFVVTKFILSGDVIRLFNSDLIWLVLVMNPGMAFGVRIIPSAFLAIIAFTAAIGLGIFLYRKSSLSLWQGFPFALIIGGAIGNLIDRLTLGEVVDFISINMPDFIIPRWPAFNLADSALSVGIVWILIVSLIGRVNRGQVENEDDNVVDNLNSV